MKKFYLKPLAKMLLGGLVITNSMSHAFAYDLGEVSSGTGTGDATNVSNSAPAHAPTQGSLTATEPQSVISQQYIENNMTGASNYTDIVAIAPSVSTFSPNGPGGNDNPSLSLRGFQDGQFNVTIDGLPFSDGADFTHHANAYMLGEDTGKVVVDRGPGGVGDVGDATFGGTIALYSKDPLSDAATTARVQSGSFNSHLAGAQFDTGVMQNNGDTSGFIDYNHFLTNGALTNNNEVRDNLFAKLVKPIGEDTAITVVVMNNTTYQNASQGATAAQISKYGTNFGLNQDPTSQAFVGYNHDLFTTNLDYIGLQSRQGDWKVDNKVYTNSYAHTVMQGQDPSGSTPNPGYIPGVTSFTQYTSYGDVLKVTDGIGMDDLNFGVWVERQNHESFTNNVNLSTGGTGSLLSTQQAEHSSMTTIQPYLDYVWRPTSKWALTPGIKLNSFNRSYNAPVDQNTGAPLSYSKTWNAVLPSFDAHYYLADNWSAYGQVAEGFLAPLLAVFSNTNPAYATQNLQASKTMNYQIGSVYKSNEMTLSGDVYYIKNNNLAQAFTVGGLTSYQNAGSVSYRGVEGEATYNIGSGLNLYGNYSFNGVSSANQIFNVPQNTAALGVMFNQGAANASLITKEIGSRLGGLDAFGNATHLRSYAVTNFSTGYLIGAMGGWLKNAKAQLQVDNIFNRTDIIAQAGNTQQILTPGAAQGDSLFWTLPGRSISLNLSAAF